jgi:LacI family transcriptional regulator
MPRGTGGPTITEVAEVAGVSRATVSRVLNGRPTVNPEIGARVREAAQRLNYRPNFTARNLSTGRTHTIALLVPDLGNPLFQTILRSLSAAAEDDGYSVLVAEAPDVTREAAIARDARNRCDAVVLCAPRMDDVALDALVGEIAPVVLLNRQVARGQVATVRVDYHAGMRLLAEHLWSLGHRDVMFVCGPPRSQANADRLDALGEFQDEHPSLRLRSMVGGATMADGYRVADQALASGATALLAFNDLAAFGIVARLNEIGVAVPGDVSVTGFDGIELSGFAVPSLTTVRQDEDELGRSAWKALHDRITGAVAGSEPAPSTPTGASPAAATTSTTATPSAAGSEPGSGGREDVLLAPRFVARDSTGRVPPTRVPSAIALDTLPATNVPEEPGGSLRWVRDVRTAAETQGKDPDDVDPREGWALQYGNRVLADLRTGAAMTAVHSPRPHLHPVLSLGGRAMSGVNPIDHRHHYGVGLAVPDVNGSSFWGGRTFVEGRGPTLLANHGTQRLDRVVPQGDDRALGASIRWVSHDGADVAREDRRLATFLLPGADGWALDWDTSLHADVGDLLITSPANHGRPGAGYGGFFWRLPDGDETRVRVREGEGEGYAHGSESPFLIVERRHGQEWSSLILVQDEQAQGRVDPWFVRSTDYVGVGASLAWKDPMHVPSGGVLPIRVTAAVLDRRATADDVDLVLDARARALQEEAEADAAPPVSAAPPVGTDHTQQNDPEETRA